MSEQLDIQRPRSARRALFLIAGSLFLTMTFGCDLLDGFVPPDDNARDDPDLALSINAIAVGPDVQAEKTALFFGKITPNRQTRLGFASGGPVQTITFRVGETAKKGETLAELDQSALKQQQSELEKTLETLQENPPPAPAAPNPRIQQIEAQLAEMNEQLAKGIITAPYDCRIAEIYVNEGGAASPQSPVLQILEDAAPLIDIDIPGKIAKRLDDDFSLSIVMDGEAIQANIYSTSPTVNPAGDVRLRLQFTTISEANTWTFGESVECRFGLGEPGSGYWLPFSALQGDAQGVWSILIVEKDASATDEIYFRASSNVVELLQKKDDWALVNGDFEEGALVVANGAHRVVAGQRVRVRVVTDQFTPPQPTGAPE